MVSSPKLIYHDPSPTKNQVIAQDTSVSKNSGTPKWMLYDGKPY